MADNQDDTVNETMHILEEDSDSTKAPSTVRTIVNYMVLASTPILFSLGSVCAQSLGGTIPPFELNMWRYLAEFVLVAPVLVIRRSQRPRKEDALALLGASVLSSAFNITYYTGAIYLPVGTLGCMTNGLTVIVTGLIMMAFCIKNCSKDQAIAIVVSAVGTVLLCQPWLKPLNDVYDPYCQPSLAFSNQPTLNGTSDVTPHFVNGTSDETPYFVNGTSNVTLFDTQTTKIDLSLHREIIGYGLAFGSALTTALTYILVNRNLQDLDSLTVNACVGAFGVVASACLMAAIETPTLPGSAVCAFLLLGHALGAAGGNIAVVMSLQMFNPALVALVTLLKAVILFVAQYTVLRYTNPGRQNAAEIVGASVIVLSNIVTPLYKLCTQYTTKK